jgi:hypothetical protein
LTALGGALPASRARAQETGATKSLLRGIGDNCSLVDVLLVNPSQAVDFGTHPAGRHLIRNWRKA